MNDAWLNGINYERYMGRWSTLIAKEFLTWLNVPINSIWLDVGCGTGTLTKIILEAYEPEKIIAVDASEEFIAHARQRINNPIVQLKVGRAESLDIENNTVDAVVSGLVLNFVPEPETAVLEMKRVTKPGGKIGIFLWDYAEGMQMLRYFWNAAIELDDKAKELDEGIRFPICREGQLESLFRKAGFINIDAKQIIVNTVFRNFEDYWEPFLGSVGPAPAYTMSLNHDARKKLEDKLRKTLPIGKDGSISLTARAWAVMASG